MINFVLPGILEVIAKFFLLQITLIRDDLPTLDLPMKANSGMDVFGQSRTELLLFINSELEMDTIKVYFLLANYLLND